MPALKGIQFPCAVLFGRSCTEPGKAATSLRLAQSFQDLNCIGCSKDGYVKTAFRAFKKTTALQYSFRGQDKPNCEEDVGSEPICITGDNALESVADTRGGLLQIACKIGVATALSKLLGLIRELILASAFGAGPVMDAFSYASIIPGFFLGLLGGVNGPLHTITAAALSKHTKGMGQILIQKLSLAVGMASAVLSVAVFGFSRKIIDAVAPGLLHTGSSLGPLTREIAILQVKLMSPCIFISSLVGISFGEMSAMGMYGIPSLSPSISSIAIIACACLYLLKYGKCASSPENLMLGGITIALATSIGAFCQWGMQATVQFKAGYKLVEIDPKDLLWEKSFVGLLSLVIPATLGSGMLQIATYTDLHFASYIPGAAACLGYANLLVMAPLGILSSSILLPAISLFSRLSEPSHWLELHACLQEAVFLCMVLTLSMTLVMVPLSMPIVCVVFQRVAFDATASKVVSSLVVCYVLGSTFYLLRDLLVRVFYALGDGHLPFLISMASILLNALLDWALVKKAGFGVEGLVLATLSVNVLSCGALYISLFIRIGGPNLFNSSRSVLVMLCAAGLGSLMTKFSYNVCYGVLLKPLVHLSSRSIRIPDLLSITFASGVGTVTFLVLLTLAGIPELESLKYLARQIVSPLLRNWREQF